MDLILWRHAQAEDGIDDDARELTAKGRLQAEKAAAFLRSRLPAHTRILVSPAKRTQQTAAALSRHFTIEPGLACGATAHAVLQLVRWPDAQDTVLLVGHQPTLGEVAALLLGCDYINVKKGALWWFSQREGELILRLVIAPDLL
jgi:phosphohistidine phosphatase